jgi:hypothetical protein
MGKTYKRDVSKEIKSISRERIGDVKNTRIILDKKSKRLQAKSEEDFYDELDRLNEDLLGRFNEDDHVKLT